MASNSDAPYLSGLVETTGKVALAKTLDAVMGGGGLLMTGKGIRC